MPIGGDAATEIVTIECEDCYETLIAFLPETEAERPDPKWPVRSLRPSRRLRPGDSLRKTSPPILIPIYNPEHERNRKDAQRAHADGCILAGFSSSVTYLGADERG